jgi:hypothetical protein
MGGEIEDEDAILAAAGDDDTAAPGAGEADADEAPPAARVLPRWRVLVLIQPW